ANDHVSFAQLRVGFGVDGDVRVIRARRKVAGYSDPLGRLRGGKSDRTIKAGAPHADVQHSALTRLELYCRRRLQLIVATMRYEQSPTDEAEQRGAAQQHEHPGSFARGRRLPPGWLRRRRLRII